MKQSDVIITPKEVENLEHSSDLPPFLSSFEHLKGQLGPPVNHEKVSVTFLFVLPPRPPASSSAPYFSTFQYFGPKLFLNFNVCWFLLFCTCRVAFPNLLSSQPVKENRTTLQKMSEAMDNDDKAAFKELLASLPLEHVRKIHPSRLKKCLRQKRSVDFNFAYFLSSFILGVLP